MKPLGILLAATLLFAPTLARAGGPSPGAEAKKVLQAYCAKCHGGGKAAKGGFGFVLDRELLVSRLLVSPGKAAQSDLFTRIQSGEMPPKSSKARPSAAEVKILQRWIEAGAPAFETATRPAKLLSPTEATDIIRTDLQNVEPRTRRFIRYLTLFHLVGAGRSGGDLDATREAAAKLINSLSWHPRLRMPEPVDADGTILRIDLRTYKWTATAWEKLVAAYPYRLQTAAESKAFADLAGTEFPALRADWFVGTASRPPLYHDLLQLPTGDRALERLLQVDVAADVKDDNILRAGFNDSGVSKNNRLLERHDAAYGTYWRSYDFANNRGRQNLFEHPLGPNTGATSFQPAGGEMIFHLPNGLQAYMLVDGKGRRIDKGPTEIVADPRRPDQRVETGISCMSCHARGLLFKADQLRGHVEKNARVFGQEIVAAVRATHPRKAKFQAQIEEDNRRYLRALEAFGLRDPNREPVNFVTQRFEGTLDGQTAAAELGLTLAEFGDFLRHNPDQARVFGGLLVKGGTGQRGTFQDAFPELARRVLARNAVLAAKATPKLAPLFEGHTGAVTAIAFSPDGTKAATGSDDRTIRVWAVPSGESLMSLVAVNMGEVYAVAFSHEGKWLLSGGRDRLVRLWDAQTGRLVRTYRGHTDSIRALAFSPDGKKAVSGGDDRSLRIWDVNTGDELTTLDGHAGAITEIAWSRGGKNILSASRDGTARWWQVSNRKQLARLEGHVGPVLSIALARDGKAALTGGNDQTIRLWSLPDAKEMKAFKGHDAAVVALRFHPNGREFFSGSSRFQASDEAPWRRWDLATRKQIAERAPGEEHRFGVAAFSPDGRYVLAGGPAGFLRLWSW